jgi:hypothetical protein
VLELDLIGLKVRLGESEVRWLYARAKATGGSSLGSRDLATRLAGRDRTQPLQRLVLSRPEARALQRLLDTSAQPPAGLKELQESLAGLLAPTERALRQSD